MKHFVTLPYLLSMYLTSSGRGFLPLVSWDQAVTPVYIVLTAAYSIQGKEEECMIHIRGSGPTVMFTYSKLSFEIAQLYVKHSVTKPQQKTLVYLPESWNVANKSYDLHKN